MFDNRTLINKVGLSGLQKRLDDYRGQGRQHFAINVGDQRLGYCYIRKNACSSFKRMFLDLAPAKYERRADERPIDFMRRHHLMTESDLAQCDRLVLVYRDPVQRIMSMFRNKFIAVNGAVDIHRNFERLEERRADEITFRYFVERYLQRDFHQVDRHVQPQSVHMRRAVYTDVIPVKKLHEGMTEVLGPEIADRYFQRPVNRTSDIELRHVAGASELPLAHVRQVFEEQGFMPDNESFLPADLKGRLKARYASDYGMIERFRKSSKRKSRAQVGQ